MKEMKKSHEINKNYYLERYSQKKILDHTKALNYSEEKKEKRKKNK